MKQRIPTINEYVESITEESKLMSDDDLKASIFAMTINDKRTLAKLVDCNIEELETETDIVLDRLKAFSSKKIKKYFPELLESKINEDTKVTGILFECISAGVAETYTGEARSCDVLENQVLEALYEDKYWYRAKFTTDVNLLHTPGLSGKRIAPNSYSSSRGLELIIRKTHIQGMKEYEESTSNFWAEFKLIKT